MNFHHKGNTLVTSHSSSYMSFILLKLSNIMANPLNLLQARTFLNVIFVSITIIVKVITEYRNKGENTNLKLN